MKAADLKRMMAADSRCKTLTKDISAQRAVVEYLEHALTSARVRLSIYERKLAEVRLEFENGQRDISRLS